MRLLIALFCVIVLGGGLVFVFLPPRTSVARGSDAITVDVDDAEVETAIRKELYLVEKAMQEAIIAYGLEGLTVKVVIRDIGSLGETAPSLNPLLEVDAATIQMSSSLFTDPEHDLEAALGGLMAHELAHALHYSTMSDVDLVVLGEHYASCLREPGSTSCLWVEAYEQLTDMTAIAHGFAEPLVAQKLAADENIELHHPRNVWTFYLTPEEIRSLDADRGQLRARLDAALRIIELDSLTRFVNSMDVGAP